jgi:nucleoside transporter
VRDGAGGTPGAVPRLAVMMFLQYAVWGAWLPVAAKYLTASVEAGGLGFSNGQMGLLLGLAASVGAVTAPFIAGQLTDRYVSAQRFLATLLLVGGAIQWSLASQRDYDTWLWLSIAYSVLYMPTLALSNSVAFAHIADRTHDFPRVRVWGTIGWIAASWIFPMIWLQSDLSLTWMPPFLAGPELADATAHLADALRFSALLSVAYAAYCLTLPHTPPNRDATQKLAFARAFGLLARPSFALLVVAGLLVSIVHNIYFMEAGPYLSALGLRDSDLGPAMTIGQFSEIAVIGGLGWMFTRFGFRAVLTIGALSYVLRYLVWSRTGLPVPVLVGSLVLHGVGYACFFAASYIYVDRLAPADIRHSAQTVFGIIMLGGGPVIGGWLLGRLAAAYSDSAGTLDFSALWLTLSGIAVLAFLAVSLMFRDETATADAATRAVRA